MRLDQGTRNEEGGEGGGGTVVVENVVMCTRPYTQLPGIVLHFRLTRILYVCMCTVHSLYPQVAYIKTGLNAMTASDVLQRSGKKAWLSSYPVL